LVGTETRKPVRIFCPFGKLKTAIKAMSSMDDPEFQARYEKDARSLFEIIVPR